MSSKPPRRPVSQATVERTKLRQAQIAIEVRPERLERPTTSGLFIRPDVSKRLTATDISKLIRKAGMKPMGGGGGGGDAEVHVELSAAVPWVDGRGWLEAAGALQNWFATTTIGFYPENFQDEEGILSIWMDGLTEGDAYVVEIRVGGWSANPQNPGTFHIGASDAATADIQQSGANQTLSVILPAVGGPMSLINVSTKRIAGWYLDDVRVLHIGKLGG
jgi:hypothetical protein